LKQASAGRLQKRNNRAGEPGAARGRKLTNCGMDTVRVSGLKEVEPMKKNGKMCPVWILAVIPLMLSGCAAIGPGSVTRDRFDYTTAISDSWKTQMLFNIVKARYGDAPVFLDVASVITQYQLEAAAGASATWQSPLAQSPNANSLNVTGAGRFIDRPTITYNPVTGAKFARSMMAPIPPTSILNLVQAGYPVDLVIRVCVQSINGIQNRYGGLAQSRPADPEFYPLLKRMRKVQAAGDIGLRVSKTGEKEGAVMVFRRGKDKTVNEDTAAIRATLGLDPDAMELKIVYGAIAADNKEIAILSRSMLQIIIDLASVVEVPEIHVEEKRASPTMKDQTPEGAVVPPLIRIHSSFFKPDDAFVAIPYRDHWFWIDDKDLVSKGMFSFLMFIFTLTETGEKEGAPIVTIPIG